MFKSMSPVKNYACNILGLYSECDVSFRPNHQSISLTHVLRALGSIIGQCLGMSGQCCDLSLHSRLPGGQQGTRPNYRNVFTQILMEALLIQRK